MKGLEICKQYFLTYGRDMLDGDFADVKDRIAAGLAGEGSECMGFDDELSRDHDFEPAFCLWLTKEDERKFGFKLARAYAKLPKEFMGLKRQNFSPMGGDRHGVLVIDDFYEKLLGAPHAPDTAAGWLHTPEHCLATACSGEVWADPLGAFSAIRGVLLKGYPEDIRRKKLAARAAVMAQAGQYNYARCISRKENGAAQLAVFEFVKNAAHTVYLLNGRYAPYDKWIFRGMRDLPVLSSLEEPLTFLLETGNSPAEAQGKAEIIEDVAAMICDEYRSQKLSAATCINLSTHANAITDGIRDADIRNLHLMDGAN